jgi:hypothetical protein
MSANDIRELENLDRIPAELGGDLYLINGNMTRLEDAGIFAKKDEGKEALTMNFEKELKKRKTNIRACSIQSDIPYATLYPIIKGQVDIGTCSYFTVAKLARFLGYRPDEIVYEKEDFQTFRNNLHHRIKSDELECILEIIESDDVSTYMRHEDYLKALYLVATVDYISRKNDIPLCDKYSSVRRIRLEQPYYVGDSSLFGADRQNCIDEFLRFNIYEGDLYDAV